MTDTERALLAIIDLLISAIAQNNREAQMELIRQAQEQRAALQA